MFRFTTIHPARLHHLRVPAEDLHHQCGLALLSLLVNRRALVEQQLHKLRVAIGARLHQRGPALLVLLVDRRALIEQQLRQHLRVGLVARYQQRGPTLLSPFSLTDAPWSSAQRANMCDVRRSQAQPPRRGGGRAGPAPPRARRGARPSRAERPHTEREESTAHVFALSVYQCTFAVFTNLIKQPCLHDNGPMGMARHFSTAH